MVIRLLSLLIGDKAHNREMLWVFFTWKCIIFELTFVDIADWKHKNTQCRSRSYPTCPFVGLTKREMDERESSCVGRFVCFIA